MLNDFINGVRSCLSIPQYIADRLIAAMQKRKPEERGVIVDRLQLWNEKLAQTDAQVENDQLQLFSILDRMEHAMDRAVRAETETSEHAKETEDADNLLSNLSLSQPSHG
ncbi:hypothetical protein A3D88_04805 [Candidatus Peribacteria bacterium RIFCSPHIGHO2_02_FULL_52_16]|nr:MAG: hypothetical protein A2706_04755 [Candidatus Peribacteria bacterium RIFCSPHIGHO2_01_FULL_51_35]OGJ60601.1 MAG: hypothetical protein A3D88_04805 [Candidatus Peribacteria bacterium RIFCSPHIGHO2_02_FULL_52_16]